MLHLITAIERRVERLDGVGPSSSPPVETQPTRPSLHARWLGFLLARLGEATPLARPAAGGWAIGGALLPLGVIGGLSIGSFVHL
jgi:hypothetical protein